MSTSTEIDRVIKGFYCTTHASVDVCVCVVHYITLDSEDISHSQTSQTVLLLPKFCVLSPFVARLHYSENLIPETDFRAHEPPWVSAPFVTYFMIRHCYSIEVKVVQSYLMRCIIKITYACFLLSFVYVLPFLAGEYLYIIFVIFFNTLSNGCVYSVYAFDVVCDNTKCLIIEIMFLK